jgi:acyl carrier protein
MSHFEVHHVREFFAALESAGVIQLSRHLDPASAASQKQDLSFEDLGVDSLTLLEISVKLEDAYGVSLSPRRIGSSKTVMGLFKLIQET